MKDTNNNKNKFLLHRAVFDNNIKLTEKLLHEYDINEKDCHCNTPLHIAIMLGHKDIINLLLKWNASVNVTNKDGWNCLSEAISYGNRETISQIFTINKNQSIASLKNRKPHFIKVLNSLKDFYMELKWEFYTWIPILSSILPSDICKIYKSGSSLRMDTTLISFSEKSWQRGDVTLIFNPNLKNDDCNFVFLDNKKQCYQKICHRNLENKDLEFQVDMLMTDYISNINFSTKNITFTDQMSGWLFKKQKTEEIGSFLSKYYVIDGLKFITKKRQEHLLQEDLNKNKEFLKNFASGFLKQNQLGSELESVSNSKNKLEHKVSLHPPPKINITFDEYLSCNKFSYLGRQRIEKTSTKNFKAVVAMSENCPLSKDVLIDLLEIMSPFKHVEKLREFCNVCLPPGFPVKLKILLLPTISADIIFQKFEWKNNSLSTLFSIPSNYRQKKVKYLNF